MKPPPRDFGYFLSLVPSLLAIFGNLVGGYWTLSNIVFTAVILTLLDWLTREDTRSPEPQPAFLFDVILALHVLTHTLAIGTLIYGVASGTLTGAFVWFAAVAVGLNSGTSGIIVAHELMHREEKSWQWAGIWNLILVGYAHFMIEHIKGHHKNIATSQDSVTARFGEDAYSFAMRAVGCEWRGAWHHETARLKKRGKPVFSLHNFIVVTGLIELVLLAGVTSMFGWAVFFVVVMQAIIGVFLLQLTSYLEHYALERQTGAKVDGSHAWQTDKTFTRFVLLELSRHSDHHVIASRPFHTLVSNPESPKLPTGYLGLLPVLLVPPVWFKLIHPRLITAKAASKAAREGLGITE
ncbi:MAG: alkane 1-monooxygenase [Rhizobacter sp.]|nr:alkane 1-monooxygenase [Chlorobiales bacterium]